MNKIQNNILEFLNSNKVSTVCFVDAQGKPYCINCFYKFDDESNCLIFKSSFGATHDSLIKPTSDISGTILPDAINVLKLQGIQFCGTLLDKTEIDAYALSTKYAKKYPMSLTMTGYVWAVKINYMKFTDNTMGFGNKTIWGNR